MQQAPNLPREADWAVNIQANWLNQIQIARQRTGIMNEYITASSQQYFIDPSGLSETQSSHLYVIPQVGNNLLYEMPQAETNYSHEIPSTSMSSLYEMPQADSNPQNYRANFVQERTRYQDDACECIYCSNAKPVKRKGTNLSASAKVGNVPDKKLTLPTLGFLIPSSKLSQMQPSEVVCVQEVGTTRAAVNLTTRTSLCLQCLDIIDKRTKALPWDREKGYTIFGPWTKHFASSSRIITRCEHCKLRILKQRRGDRCIECIAIFEREKERHRTGNLVIDVPQEDMEDVEEDGMDIELSTWVWRPWE